MSGWELLGVALGGLIGFASGILTLQYQRRFERKSLAAALGAEMALVVARLEHDDPFNTLKLRAAGFGAIGQPVKPIDVEESDYRLFVNTAAELGLLPKGLAGKVAEYYSRLVRLKGEIDLFNSNPGHGGFRIDFERSLANARDLLIADGKRLCAHLSDI